MCYVLHINSMEVVNTEAAAAVSHIVDSGSVNTKQKVKVAYIMREVRTVSISLTLTTHLPTL